MSTGDTSANTGVYWQGRLEAVLAGEFDPPVDLTELTASRKEVLTELPVTVPETTRRKGLPWSGSPSWAVTARA